MSLIIQKQEWVIPGNLRSWHPESQVIVSMTPSKFLRLTTEPGVASFKKSVHFSKNALNKIKSAFRAKRDMDMTWLELRRERTSNIPIVDRHEGRHRALAAMESGLKKIPVLLYFTDKNSEYEKADKRSAEIWYGEIIEVKSITKAKHKWIPSKPKRIIKPVSVISHARKGTKGVIAHTRRRPRR